VVAHHLDCDVSHNLKGMKLHESQRFAPFGSSSPTCWKHKDEISGLQKRRLY